MKSLFLMGTPDSGKTAVALGLALKFQELGYKVGYFKPVDNGRRSISGKIPGGDAVLMKSVLSLEASVGQMNPVKAGPDYLNRFDRAEDNLKEIKLIFEEVSNGCDIVLVEGAVFPHALAAVGLDSVTLARELGCQVLTTVKAEDDNTLDLAVFYNRYLAGMQIPCLGTVFSNVPRQMVSKVEGVFSPVLEKAGFKTAGVIPSHPEISFPTVREYQEILGGEVLVGNENQANMDQFVEDIVIGAMNMESALSYLRRAANKAVVMGGDRADLALAALETQTSALILTGGLYPDVKILASAEEKGVPVILTHQDTFTVVELLGRAFRHLKPGDTAGINIARENVDKYCNWQSLVDVLEL
ncbi:MAG: phosphotransacetylase family protein [Firmicutes bacterium]|nr:phosphotransacetylase family protein [Bacillota bacterium]